MSQPLYADPLPGPKSVVVLDLAAIPRAAQSRQRFNDALARARGKRYLVGRWGEDRGALLAGTAIAAAGRTVHLGVDVFSPDCAEVLAPCDGVIVGAGYEPGPAGWGHWRVVEPGDGPWILYGHLGAGARADGPVRAAEPFARLGDAGENGGWSRHLHLQMLTSLPAAGEPPPGYATHGDREALAQFPDPGRWFAAFAGLAAA